MAISQNYRHVTENPKAYIDLTIKEANKLHRLVSLSSHLSGSSKSRNWLEFTSKEDLENLRKTRNLNLNSILVPLNPHFTDAAKKPSPPPLSDLLGILERKVSNVALAFLKDSLTDDPKAIAQLYHDLKAINTAPPMQKTLAGKNGPTFIVSYPLISKSKESSQQNSNDGVSCVLKWTDDAEITAHRFFEAFATGFQFKRNLYERECFFVPKLTYFDLNKGMLLERNRTYSLSENEKKCLQEQLNGSVIDYQLPKPNFNGANKLIARLEKVSGKNFPEFAQADFPGLSDEVKASLFRRLGKIAFLDFVLGNTDRLFSIDTQTVTLGNYEANLDNLMLQSLDEGVAIFLIDNAIDPFFLEGDFKERYLTLIKDTFTAPDFSTILAKSVVEGISQGMSEIRNSAEFRRDLNQFGLENIQKGLEEMKDAFQAQVSEFMPNSKPLDTYCAGLNKEISDVISERIRTVSSILKKPKTLTQEIISPEFTNPNFTMERSPENHSIHFSLNDSFNLSFSGSPSKWRLPPEAPLKNFLWEISNHCKGTQEDVLFFQTILIPDLPAEYLSESVNSIISILCEIKNISDPRRRFQKMLELNKLVKLVLESELHIPNRNLSPLNGAVPSPLKTRNLSSATEAPSPLIMPNNEHEQYSIPPPLLINPSPARFIPPSKKMLNLTIEPNANAPKPFTQRTQKPRAHL